MVLSGGMGDAMGMGQPPVMAPHGMPPHHMFGAPPPFGMPPPG